MSLSTPPTESEVILARFVLDLEEADNPEAVIRVYRERHPPLAARFVQLAATRQQIERSAETAELPRKLGDFRLDAPVARGGMGRVFAAVEERLQRRVAVKVIHRHLCLPEFHARFVREQQVLARLHHTDIVPILAAGEVGAFQYFAMPYINGATLQHVLAMAQQPTLWPGGTAPDLSTLARIYRRGSTLVAPATITLPDQPAASTPATEPAVRPLLSRAYFASVARILADAADALHHAHEQGIVHRDVKPSNIMVARDDKGEKCWVIDFGLAGFHGNAPADPGPNDMTVTGIMGTPPYMAPEQWTDPTQVDRRTDVWGLGATLYHLLTLRAAFAGEDRTEVRQAVLTAAPRPPRAHDRRVPADLEAICLHALRKEPGERYPTARAFAEDVRRFLRGEPPLVARHYRRRQAAWHARQHKALIGIVGTMVVALIAAFAGWGFVEKAGRDAAQREALILQAQQIRLDARTADWSTAAWNHLREAAAIRADEALKREAVAVLAGLDARPHHKFTQAASAVAFDRAGARLLLGGTAGQPARLWSSVTGRMLDSGCAGDGPVAFREDGAALQFVTHPVKAATCLLWDVVRKQPIREFALPAGAAVGKNSDLHLAMAPGGTFVAVATTAPGRAKGTLVIWDARSGQAVKIVERRFSALALSPDGGLFAGGAEDGQITVGAIAGAAPPLTWQASRTAVHSLVFGRNPLRRLGDSAGRPAWLLASGSAGANVTVWDVHTGLARSFCHGSNWDVYALAFSPDGTMLAAAGRSIGRVYDVATGRELLRLPEVGDWAVGLAFSADGRQLASCADPPRAHPLTEAIIFDVELGRGIDVLRGVAGALARIRFSPDDRLLAALAQDWHVAIWDVARGALLHLFEVPKGMTADNAGFAFSTDGRYFAFAAGTQAKRWEIASGKELDSWDLPPGLVDQLAFRPDGTLILCRVETADQQPPVRSHPWQAHPRICPLRRLPPGKPPETIATIDAFARGVATAAITADGRYVVIEGLGGTDGTHCRLTVYDGASGQPLHTLLEGTSMPRAMVMLDPTGSMLGFADSDGPGIALVELPSAQVAARLDGGAAISPRAELIQFGDDAGRSALLRRKDGARLLTFAAGTAVFPGGPFNAAGTLWTSGHAEGGVIVGDLNELRRRLATIGLGW